MLPPLTQAEQQALDATKLESFPVNLEDIRRTVSDLLLEFGRYSFFDEYTTHSFDHVHEMLVCLDWLIPNTTKALLTKGDWWLIVMSCYFHDLGLVVTRDEFKNRDQSGIARFCENHLFAGESGPDYKAKLEELPVHEREKILYQEFVRYHHAERVHAWILGERKPEIGDAAALASEIDRLLGPLENRIRVDLAHVCESHNLNDLDDEKKYPLFQPYGRSSDETVNVQYAALILRTVDLIQITRQRAPTVLYRVINPADPISQIEWQKQNAVRHLRPKPASAKKIDILEEVRRWILIPRCNVWVTIDDEPAIKIGYASPRDALEARLAQYYACRPLQGRREDFGWSNGGICPFV